MYQIANSQHQNKKEVTILFCFETKANFASSCDSQIKQLSSLGVGASVLFDALLELFLSKSKNELLPIYVSGPIIKM